MYKFKIIIEEFLSSDVNRSMENIHVYCFNGVPKLFVRLYGNNKITLYDEKFNLIDDVLSEADIKVNEGVNDLIKQTFILSQKLAQPFNFVRIDWIIYKSKLYFEELTFTPHSGFLDFCGNWNLELGNFLNLERN